MLHTRVVPLEQQLEASQATLQLVHVPGQGRGLFAAQAIGQGATVHREAPMACTGPPGEAMARCRACLQPFLAGAAPVGGGVCADCAAGGEAASAWWRLFSRCDWGPLETLCAATGEKFPMLAARLACQSLADEGDAPRRAGEPRGRAATDLALLCFARVPPPVPAPWVAQHEALLACLRPALGAERAFAEDLLTLAWYADVQARLHLNVFRVDTLDAAALAPLSEAFGGDWMARKGSAVYAMASLFNHACEPNLDVCFPQNSALLALRAARDVDPGEQLTLSYIDTSLPLHKRRQALEQGYGFRCRCPRCREEEEEGGTKDT